MVPSLITNLRFIRKVFFFFSKIMRKHFCLYFVYLGVDRYFMVLNPLVIFKSCDLIRNLNYVTANLCIMCIFTDHTAVSGLEEIVSELLEFCDRQLFFG